jgi:hypothetical protein
MEFVKSIPSLIKQDLKENLVKSDVNQLEDSKA